MFSLLINLIFSAKLFNNRNLPNDILIITRNGCAYSRAMRSYLSDNQIAYVDLNEDELGISLIPITNKPEHTYPLVYINSEYVGGFEEAAVSPEISKRITTRIEVE